MKHEYTVDLSTSGINKFIGVLGGYKIWLNKKADELAKRLAEMGAVDASLRFARAIYTGDNDTEITVERTGKASYTVKASGVAVLFIEFGSGFTYGYGHPDPQKFGPGTYPGEGHWDDPNGWYLPKKKGGDHTFGNPPAAAMYNTVKDLEQELSRVVQEVFSR